MQFTNPLKGQQYYNEMVKFIPNYFMKIDLDELFNAGILNEGQVTQIRDFYKSKADTAPTTLLRIVSIIGVSLIGIGILYILAHNWDTLSKWTRLTISLLPLIACQTTGMYALIKKRDSQVWNETIALGIFFSVGIAMALISQIYNIEGNLHDFLLWWITLTIPLSLLFDSAGSSIAVWICIGWLLTTSDWNKTGDEDIFHSLLIVVSLAIYIIKAFRNEKLFIWRWHHWVVPVVLLLYYFSVFHNECNKINFAALLVCSGIGIRIGKSSRLEHMTWMNGFMMLGLLGITIISYIFSFRDFWNEMKTSYCDFSQLYLVPVVAGMLVIGYSIWNDLRKSKHISALISSLPIFFILVDLAGPTLPVTMIWLIINLIILTLIGTFIYHGIQTGKWLFLNGGLLLLIVWVICRHNESHLSFVVRGIIFIALGLLCFGMNVYLLKMNKK